MSIRTLIARRRGRAEAQPQPNPQDTTGFDAAWYLRAYPDVAASGLNPLRHYLQSGWREGRSPAADFDGLFYRMTVSAPLAPDLCPLAHWNRAGRAANAPRSRAEALAGTPFRPDAALVVAAHPGLADLFDADHYLTRYPDALHSGPDPLAHYLTHGWQEGRNPSAGFDTAFYRERFMSGDAADICPLLHYHLYGRAAALPPTRREAMERSRALAAGQRDPAQDLLSGLPAEVRAALLAPFFSPGHYLVAYPDVARSGSDPYWHYISTGWREGRSPGPLFDPATYAAPAGDLPPLLHYAVIGRMTGQSGSRHETALAQERAAATLADERLADLLLRLGGPADLTDRRQISEVILPMFSAADCRRRHGLGPAPSDAEVFLRYLALDLPAGIPPGPLFSAGHYLTEVARLGLPPLRPQEHAFHHWLRHGYAAGASPTPAFAASDYLTLNGDLADHSGPLWGHFIRHGAAEGRRFSFMTTVAPSNLAALSDDRAPRSLRLLELLSGASADFQAMQDFHRSGKLERTIAEAARHEPEVGELGPPPHIHSMIPPWSDAGWAEYEQVLNLLPGGRFDAVVLVPSCKLGGSDFVAGVLTATLAEAGRKVLVLRNDAPDWARPDWFPPDCASVDLSRHLGKVHQPLRMRMLYELLVRLRPADVYNVNSRLAFETFERFGERLALMMRLNAYYFCTDRTPEGAEIGYPVWYFSNILGHMSSALIDNAALAGQLIRRFGLSGEWRDRVRVIYTPAMTPPPAVPLADQQVQTTPQRPRKRILWAGRLDAQKRFDLVQDIARLLPNVDFDCWGKAVRDAPPDLSRLPANLRMHGAFHSYGDLPLAASDGWLYTSGWDGIPTILIELAAHGLPIVASAVGGVPELIDETTGWPLPAEATAADYAAAITAMLAAPEERRKRAAALQDRVRRQHSRAAYSAALAYAAKGG